MKAHTKIFMTRLDRAFTAGTKGRELGTKDPNFFEKMQLLVRLVETFLPMFKEVFQSREHLTEMIDKLDPNQREFPLLLAFIDNLPKFGRYLALELSEMGKSNTPATRAGRPRSLPVRKEKDVIDFISERQQQNPYEKLSVSQERAAKKFGISPRTCRRIWNGRTEPRLDIEAMKNLALSFFQSALIETQLQPETSTVAALPAPKLGGRRQKSKSQCGNSANRTPEDAPTESS